MLFFILVVAAVIGVAVYVTKKTKSSQSTFLAPGETLIPDPIEETIPPVTVTEVSVPTTPPSVPTMTAKPKKKSSTPKAKSTDTAKKPTKKKTNA